MSAASKSFIHTIKEATHNHNNLHFYLPKIAGTMQRQFVNMAPLTTSISGRIWKNRIANPIV